MADSCPVLVTGSAGYIGRAVCAELKARGHKVRGFDRVPSTELEDFQTGDLSDPQAIERALSGMACVVHLGAIPGGDDFMGQLLPSNILGVYHVLEASQKAGVRRIILTSSGQVVDGHEGPGPATSATPFSPSGWYAVTKVFAEAAGQIYARRDDLHVMVVRPGWCPSDRRSVEAISRMPRAQDIYLSPGDAGRFFACAVEADLTSRFVVLYATSHPVKETRFDIQEAKRLIGYEPRDTWPQGTEFHASA